MKKNYKLFNYLYALFIYRNNFVVVNGWLNIQFGHIIKRNFGDELNYYILHELFHKNVVGYYDIPHLVNYTDLLFIGSLVEEFTTPNTIIWGSGAINGKTPIRYKPAKVCAVRGKLTQQYLIEQGVECPSIYGDPALLLPLVYHPKLKKKYKIGLIPHINDLDNHLVTNLLKDNDVHLIDFKHYADWKSVIDQINECEAIISSSLHGLIISDAYKIPNLWIRFSDNILGGHFKYLDYFSGVGRICNSPVQVTTNTTIKQLQQKLCDYIPIHFDPQTLLNACPFKIKVKCQS